MDVIRIEMVMPSVALAEAKFPEAQKTFCGGVAKLSYRAAGIVPSIFLEGAVVVVELGFNKSGAAERLLPVFEKQCKDAFEKEMAEKGDCIETRVFIKEVEKNE